MPVESARSECSRGHLPRDSCLMWNSRIEYPSPSRRKCVAISGPCSKISRSIRLRGRTRGFLAIGSIDPARLTRQPLRVEGGLCYMLRTQGRSRRRYGWVHTKRPRVSSWVLSCFATHEWTALHHAAQYRAGRYGSSCRPSFVEQRSRAPALPKVWGGWTSSPAEPVTYRRAGLKVPQPGRLNRLTSAGPT
jgi:hypothetical protein